MSADRRRWNAARRRGRRRKPPNDIIDKMNEYLRAVHGQKLCPKCGGPLLQHQKVRNALFCSSCFGLYGLRELTFDQWWRLVSRKRRRKDGKRQ